MLRSYDGKVASVQGCDRLDVHALSCGDQRCIDRPEGQIAISRHELGDAKPVVRPNRLGNERAGSEVTDETDFRTHTKSCREEIRDFSDDQLWHEERPGVRGEQLEADLVIDVVPVDVCVKRARIYEERDPPSSTRKICSIFRATSRCPLRPAFAAIRRRGELP